MDDTVMSNSEAVRAIEALIRYDEQQEEAGLSDIMDMTKWRDIAAKKHKQCDTT